MNGSVIYLTLFGSQTLWNGTTHYAANTLTAAYKAKFKPIALPNGRLFDPYQTYDAPTEPAPFDYKLLLKLAQDAAVAEFEAITALVGTRATLTGKRLTTAGATTTCTARLTAVSNISPDSTDAAGGLLLKLTFTPLDAWT